VVTCLVLPAGLVLRAQGPQGFIRSTVSDGSRAVGPAETRVTRAGVANDAGGCRIPYLPYLMSGFYGLNAQPTGWKVTEESLSSGCEGRIINGVSPVAGCAGERT
jgi:hypothetical protein